MIHDAIWYFSLQSLEELHWIRVAGQGQGALDVPVRQTNLCVKVVADFSMLAAVLSSSAFLPPCSSGLFETDMYGLSVMLECSNAMRSVLKYREMQCQ